MGDVPGMTVEEAFEVLFCDTKVYITVYIMVYRMIYITV
jgi:hypothetical protein